MAICGITPFESTTKIDGQGWSVIEYARLPEKAEGMVKKPIWSLSRHSAGLSIRFKTDADSLQIEYWVNGNIPMNHMSTIGISGVDLYGKSSEKTKIHLSNDAFVDGTDPTDLGRERYA